MLDKGVCYDLGEGHLFLNRFLVEISKNQEDRYDSSSKGRWWTLKPPSRIPTPSFENLHLSLDLLNRLFSSPDFVSHVAIGELLSRACTLHRKPSPLGSFGNPSPPGSVIAGSGLRDAVQDY